MSPSHHHVLVLGGHGTIAQMLTRFLLQRAWTVTSLIRAQEQVPAIESLAAGQPGKLNVLVRSIADVSSDEQAASILNEVGADMVAWSAGAGGKGGPEMTLRIDRDAAIHFTQAAAAIPSISRFLLVSYNGSRRAAAPWWSAADWAKYDADINHGVLATYYVAKLAADEAFYRAAKASPTLTGICLRPSTLINEAAGNVTVGKVGSVWGKVPRETVAKTAAALLAAPGAKTGWIDMGSGEDDIDDAVATVIRDGVDTAEGEAIYTE